MAWISLKFPNSIPIGKNFHKKIIRNTMKELKKHVKLTWQIFDAANVIYFTVRENMHWKLVLVERELNEKWNIL